MAATNILSPLQQRFLELFFIGSAGQEFFLTGGTALAAYYLHHRFSDDLDLFTLDDEAFALASDSLPAIAAALGGKQEERLATIHLRQVFVHIPDQPDLKVDLVREFGPQFGSHQQFDDVIVDSLLNIAVNKVGALYGRAAAKDFVDLYFLLQFGFNLNDLFVNAKEKDPGFTEFYFAGMLREVRGVQRLPRMIKPLTPAELQAFFMPLAEEIMLNSRPPQ